MGNQPSTIFGPELVRIFPSRERRLICNNPCLEETFHKRNLTHNCVWALHSLWDRNWHSLLFQIPLTGPRENDFLSSEGNLTQGDSNLDNDI